MSINISTLGIKFSTGKRAYKYQAQTVLNITRRRENILFLPNVHDSTCVGINYFGGDNIESDKALSIFDRSTSIPANSSNVFSSDVVVSNISSYTVYNDNFLVTDTFVNTVSQVSVPLYYKHTLSKFTFGVDALLSVSFLDENFTPISVKAQSVDYTNGIIYNNLVPSIDRKTLEREVYYIQYSTSATKGNLELLSNQPVYTAATFDDLDDNLNIIAGKKVYLLNENENNFQVLLPGINTYAFSFASEHHIAILSPSNTDNTQPWYVSVSNNQFFATVNNQQYKYSIADFVNQSWDPIIPYKKVTGEQSVILSNRLILLGHNNIYQDTTITPLSLTISDSNNNLLATFTTNPSYGIRSIDCQTGIVDIENFILDPSYIVSSTYWYKEENYQFTDINFNPIQNIDLLGSKVSLFLEPDTNGSTKAQTLYYAVVDEAGKVTNSNWSMFDNDTETYQGDIPLYYENNPTWNTVSGELFINHTVEGSESIKNGVESSNNNDNFLILGDVQVLDNAPVSLDQLTDIRVQGGGIKLSSIDIIKAMNKELNWYWDIGFWDGTPYPGNSSIYVEIPAEVLEKAGGTFTTLDIRNTVQRHIMAGTYPVIKTYGIDPQISSLVPSGTSVTVNWRSYAPY